MTDNACDKNALAVTIGKSINNASYLDSGCSNHMTGDCGLFDATKSFSTQLKHVWGMIHVMM